METNTSSDPALGAECCLGLLLLHLFGTGVLSPTRIGLGVSGSGVLLTWKSVLWYVTPPFLTSVTTFPIRGTVA